ncbi:hypothetical protein ACP3V3_02420 [Vibrio sp. PNB22_3_1]
MFDLIMFGFLNAALAVAWICMFVAVLAHRYEYEDMILYPTTVGVISFIYVLLYAAMVHGQSVIDPHHYDLFTGLVYGSSILFFIAVWFSSSQWHRREIDFITHAIWSDVEAESVSRKIDSVKTNVFEQFRWLSGVYSSNSQCNFHSKDVELKVQRLLFSEQSAAAFEEISAIIDMFLLDKITDTHREEFKVLCSFGSSVHSNDMLKLRVSESDLISEFLSQKSMALRALCFNGSVFDEVNVSAVLDIDASPSRKKVISEQLSDLYLLKINKAMMPSYRRV